MISFEQVPDAEKVKEKTGTEQLLNSVETMKQQASIFDYGDKNFSAFETLLKSWTFCSHEIWRLRVDIHQLLVDPSLSDRRQRFRYGFLSYFPWLFLNIARSIRQRYEITSPPNTEFLILICGAASKELEILAPIVQSLLQHKKTVGVAWFTDDATKPDSLFALEGAKIWQIRSGELWASAGVFIFTDTLVSIWRSILLCMRLSQEPRGLATLRIKSSRLVDRFIELRVIERYLSRKLVDKTYLGIGLASDTSTAGAAMARVCLNRGWPSHHFLHGPPDLVHARSLATDLYCFSKPEVNFLVNHGCSPEHVFACGHPSQARTQAQVSSRRNQEPNEGGLRLLYAAQPAFGEFDAVMHKEVATTLIEAANNLGLSEGEFRIRIHPSDDPNIIRQIASEILGEKSHLYISSGAVSDDLAWANVITTVHSTMAFEAAYVDVQVVWLFPERFRYGIRDALISSGLGHTANNQNELVNKLSLLRDREKRREYLETFTKIALNQSIVTSDPAGDCIRKMLKLSVLNSKTNLANRPQ